MIRLIIIYVVLLVAFVVGFFGYLHYSQEDDLQTENRIEAIKKQLELQEGKMVSPRQQRAVTGQ